MRLSGHCGPYFGAPERKVVMSAVAAMAAINRHFAVFLL